GSRSRRGLATRSASGTRSSSARPRPRSRAGGSRPASASRSSAGTTSSRTRVTGRSRYDRQQRATQARVPYGHGSRWQDEARKGVEVAATGTAFAKELYDVVAARHSKDHPVIGMIERGELSEEQLLGFAVQFYQLFPKVF